MPVFLDSKASRLIQLADLVAFATYRNFAHNDPELFDIIKQRFDTDGGVNHGLYVHDGTALAIVETTTITEQITVISATGESQG